LFKPIPKVGYRKFKLTFAQVQVVIEIDISVQDTLDDFKQLFFHHYISQ